MYNYICVLFPNSPFKNQNFKKYVFTDEEKT